jgi:hypothetical protein
VIAACHFLFGEFLHGPSPLMTHAFPVTLHPSVEFRRAAQMESIEQRTPVEPDRLIEVAPLQRGLEFGHVRSDLPRIQQEVVAFRLQGILSQCRTNRVDRRVQEPPASVGGGFRPQESDELVPTESPAGSQSEEGQQGNAMTLCDATAQGNTVFSDDGGATEPLEADHPRGVHSRFILPHPRFSYTGQYTLTHREGCTQACQPSANQKEFRPCSPAPI